MAAFGLYFSAFCSKSSNDMQRSSRLQSTNCTSAPARIAANGVAMNVLDGQSTVSPCTPAKCSAARAPPDQLDVATAGTLVPRLPRLFEAGRHLGLRPAVGVEYLVDQRVQPRPVAMVEPNREAPVVRRDLGLCGSSRHESFMCWFEFGPGRRARRAPSWAPDRAHPPHRARGGTSNARHGTEFRGLQRLQDHRQRRRGALM